MSLRTRLMLLALLLALAFAAVIGFAQYNLTAIRAIVASIYDDRVVPLSQLKAVSDAYAVKIIDTVNKAQNGLLDQPSALASIDQARHIIDEQWQAYLHTYLTAEESQLVAQASQQFVVADRAVIQLQQFLQQTQSPLAGKLTAFDGSLYQQIDPVTTTLAKLINLQLDVARTARADIGDRTAHVSTVFVWTAVLLSLLVLAAVCLLWQQFRQQRRLQKLQQAKQELLQFNAELKQQVTERSEELQHAVDELESFNFVVSNDLQAPVRHASSYLELLRDEISEVGHRDWLELVNRATRAMDRMSQMIGDMLALSRLGRDVLQPGPVDLGVMVSEMVAQLPVATRQRCQFELGTLPTVFADRALLRQVIQNLLDNAVKSCANTSAPLICVTTVQHPKYQTAVVVRDNGVGFDPAYSRHLFRLFQRLHRQDEFPGAGVGLALCAKIIHLHGGRIWAEASPGHGASFYFSLPDMNGAVRAA
ncbi:hypothetical protein HPT27_00490 [Permianibacter sp. IMCC34836]|uniref:sensor histidine kinase n=1 Tax=Permianibacter fluminis TaxID=2738515 RepID=UPI001554EC63|nr:ATP-binding protein [Permianibacter fluminis]NQD35479.1 hypothetical protein [Permianibacter fluminis]